MVLLTRFEIARLVGERTEQINRGSPIFVSERHKNDTSETIAYRELLLRKIPIIVKREVPANPPYTVDISVVDAYFSDSFIRNTKVKIEKLRQQRAEILSMVFTNT